VSCNFYPLTS